LLHQVGISHHFSSSVVLDSSRIWQTSKNQHQKDQGGAKLSDIPGYYQELSLSSSMSGLRSFFHAFTTTSTFFLISSHYCNQDGNKHGKYQLRTLGKISALLIIGANVQTGMTWYDQLTWVLFGSKLAVTAPLLCCSSLNRTCKLIRTIGSTELLASGLLEFYCTEFQYSELHGIIVTTTQNFECMPH